MPHPNLYVFDDLVADQARLLLQAQLAREYMVEHAPRFLPVPPARILDLGCGFGHVTMVLHALYPQASLVGIDINPMALAAARQQLLEDAQVDFVVGDIQDDLPPGPFDLIHCSLVLLYIPHLARVLDLVYAALAPGGTFWVKDIQAEFGGRGGDPDYQYLMDHTLAAVQQIGGHPQLETELPPLLAAAGFSDIRVEADEVYPVGGDTLEGEICLANGIALFRNVRTLVSRARGISEEAILNRCDRLLATAQASPAPVGEARLINILTRCPAADG